MEEGAGALLTNDDRFEQLCLDPTGLSQKSSRTGAFSGKAAQQIPADNNPHPRTDLVSQGVLRQSGQHPGNDKPQQGLRRWRMPLPD